MQAATLPASPVPSLPLLLAQAANLAADEAEAQTPGLADVEFRQQLLDEMAYAVSDVIDMTRRYKGLHWLDG